MRRGGYIGTARSCWELGSTAPQCTTARTSCGACRWRTSAASAAGARSGWRRRCAAARRPGPGCGSPCCRASRPAWTATPPPPLPPPPIDAPCPQCLRHSDPMHAQQRLTSGEGVAAGCGGMWAAPAAASAEAASSSRAACARIGGRITIEPRHTHARTHARSRRGTAAEPTAPAWIYNILSMMARRLGPQRPGQRTCSAMRAIARRMPPAGSTAAENINT
eukprot:COSAG01_NODE_535_length_15804_cov_33.841452_3_plen_221_part_00